MQTFHFRRLNGDLVTTDAVDEPTARAQAMEQRWGQPTGMYAPFYTGRGLARVGSDGLPVKDVA